MYFFLLLLNLNTVSGEAYLAEPLSRLGQRRSAKKYYYTIHGTAGIRFPFSDDFLNTCGESTRAGAVQATYETGADLADKIKWKMLVGVRGGPERIRVAIKYSDDDNFNDNVIYTGTNSGSTCTDGSYVMNGNCGDNPAPLREPDVSKDNVFITLAKPCDKCVLQWVWDTQQGYGFVDCADIKITGEPKTDTQTSAPDIVQINPQCENFCRRLQEKCEKDTSLSKCNSACQSYSRSILDKSTTGDTFECRQAHLENDECPGTDCKPASACNIFCHTFNQVCRDPSGSVPFLDFRGIEKCEETCSSLDQTGLVGAMTGDTLQCREFQLARASAVTDDNQKEAMCNKAQPHPTSDCTAQYKPCDTFCSSWDKWCGQFNISQYTNCTIECEEINSNGNLGDKSGDTLQCREHYLGAAALTQLPGSEFVEMHCKSAAKDGGEDCVGLPPTSNAVKLRSVLSGAFVALLAGLF